MPDTAPPADGAAITSSYLQTMLREQVIRTVTSSTRPTGVEGAVIYETDTDSFYYYTGSAWATFGSKVLQVVNTQTGAVATGTTVLPYDDTIPQNTEGDQYMTLAITPLSASSYLLIEVKISLSPSAGGHESVALFVDTTAGALAATNAFIAGFETTALALDYYVASASTTARTYKVRAGSSVAATTTLNGQNTARRFGGVPASSITITEIAA